MSIVEKFTSMRGEHPRLFRAAALLTLAGVLDAAFLANAHANRAENEEAGIDRIQQMIDWRKPSTFAGQAGVSSGDSDVDTMARQYAAYGGACEKLPQQAQAPCRDQDAQLRNIESSVEKALRERFGMPVRCTFRNMTLPKYFVDGKRVDLSGESSPCALFLNYHNLL